MVRRLPDRSKIPAPGAVIPISHSMSHQVLLSARTKQPVPDLLGRVRLRSPTMPKRRRSAPKSHPKRQPGPPVMLDLAQFGSLDDAVKKVEPGDRYVEIGKLAIPISKDLPLT